MIKSGKLEVINANLFTKYLINLFYFLDYVHNVIICQYLECTNLTHTHAHIHILFNELEFVKL